MPEAVDHGGGQQHADDAQNGHHGEDEELGGLGLAVLGGDLVDLAPLFINNKHEEEKVNNVFWHRSSLNCSLQWTTSIETHVMQSLLGKFDLKNPSDSKPIKFD